MNNAQPAAHAGPSLSGKLDFLISGIARSGTTAMVQALDLHPNLFCSEMYDPGYPFESLRLPDHFLTDARVPWSVVLLRSRLASELPFLLLGNKTQRQYFCFTGLLRHNPDLKWIHLIRDPMGFALSWDERAREGLDWKTGKIGVFGILEFAFALERLAAMTHPVMLVDYSAVFYGDPTLIDRIVAHLGVTGSPEFDAAFRDTFFSAAPRKVKHSAFYEDFLEAFRFEPILAHLSKTPGALNTDATFRRQVGDLRPVDRIDPDRVIAAIVEHGNPQALDFCVSWCRRMANLIDDPKHPVCQRFIEKLDKIRRLARRRLEATLPTPSGQHPSARIGGNVVK